MLFKPKMSIKLFHSFLLKTLYWLFIASRINSLLMWPSQAPLVPSPHSLSTTSHTGFLPLGLGCCLCFCTCFFS